MNWASLIFGSTTNFILPLVLYISSNIYPASTLDATGELQDLLSLQSMITTNLLRRWRRIFPPPRKRNFISHSSPLAQPTPSLNNKSHSRQSRTTHIPQHQPLNRNRRRAPRIPPQQHLAWRPLSSQEIRSNRYYRTALRRPRIQQRDTRPPPRCLLSHRLATTNHRLLISQSAAIILWSTYWKREQNRGLALTHHGRFSRRCSRCRSPAFQTPKFDTGYY